jgi:hypothetical protein
MKTCSLARFSVVCCSLLYFARRDRAFYCEKHSSPIVQSLVVVAVNTFFSLWSSAMMPCGGQWSDACTYNGDADRCSHGESGSAASAEDYRTGGRERRHQKKEHCLHRMQQ